MDKSGLWRGYWVQPLYGRQPMQDFHLRFRDGNIDGHGTDVIGRFVFHGDYDPRTGRVRMVKQYLGKHAVLYDGTGRCDPSCRRIWIGGAELFGGRRQQYGLPNGGGLAVPRQKRAALFAFGGLFDRD